MTIEFTPYDLEMMQEALKEADKAAEHGDVPVGAVLVDKRTGEILALGHNTREKEGSALGHAEISAIQKACDIKGTWRLSDCILYVTLEPCPMCAGAILAARIPRVICGAKDAVSGAMGSVWSLHAHPVHSPRTDISFGCLAEECSQKLRKFFKEKR